MLDVALAFGWRDVRSQKRMYTMIATGWDGRSTSDHVQDDFKQNHTQCIDDEFELWTCGLAVAIG